MLFMYKGCNKKLSPTADLSHNAKKMFSLPNLVEGIEVLGFFCSPRSPIREIC